ncbi:hypothetical protein QTP70_034680 [Hemibagrus guttatus]|uniref:Uncharacterized protein n=1 Tax=Hemibagrus guttatus TaxID=175788 RepID=A0AAE0ULB8_9TELE|nr:hypothetical protein QTP70_034680 [Hemibagrus guttatus]
MYAYNRSNVVQPGFQVVQARESQMIIQPQRQTVVMPAPQPAMMIQPAAPSVRVIQAPAPPVQVIQAPAPAVHVIQAPAPTCLSSVLLKSWRTWTTLSCDENSSGILH